MQSNDVADVVQEVFRTVASKIDDFGQGRVNSSFRGWLRAIAHNQVRLLYRKQRARPEAQFGTPTHDQIQSLATWELDDRDDSIENDRLYLLHRTLRAVEREFAPSIWRAFWLTIVEGQTAGDAASALGTTPGVVRQARYRILCRLREEMFEIQRKALRINGLHDFVNKIV